MIEHADRVIEILGRGLPAVVAAQALGISESRISQIASDPEIAAKISERRFALQQRYNDLDDKYDEVERQLLDKLSQSLVFIQRPGEIVRSLQIINGAKRRGAAAPEQGAVTQQIVNVILPQQTAERFTVTVNAANQVVRAGEQTLLTMPSAQVSNLLQEHKLNDNRTESRPRPGSRNAIATIEASEL